MLKYKIFETVLEIIVFLVRNLLYGKELSGNYFATIPKMDEYREMQSEVYI